LGPAEFKPKGIAETLEVHPLLGEVSDE